MFRINIVCHQGQYNLVLEKELPRIQEAFMKLSCNPKLSIIVCGKRHHARFPATDRDNITKNGNTLPGTVVDQGVTDIYNFDFYLQVCDIISSRVGIND